MAASPYYVRRDGRREAWRPGITGEFEQYAGFGCSLKLGREWLFGCRCSGLSFAAPACPGPSFSVILFAAPLLLPLPLRRRAAVIASASPLAMVVLPRRAARNPWPVFCGACRLRLVLSRLPAPGLVPGCGGGVGSGCGCGSGAGVCPGCGGGCGFGFVCGAGSGSGCRSRLRVSVAGCPVPGSGSGFRSRLRCWRLSRVRCWRLLRFRLRARKRPGRFPAPALWASLISPGLCNQCPRAESSNR